MTDSIKLDKKLNDQAMINIINKLMIKIASNVCQRNLNVELKGFLLDR